MSSVLDFAALSLLPVHRWPRILQQLRDGEAALAVLHQHCNDRSLRDAGSASAEQLRTRAAIGLDRARRTGLQPLAWCEPRYPAALLTIVDPPPILWVSGSLSVFDVPAVALVGSRAGSPYALAAAERLSADLAARGVVVISGMARGVDAAAHRGALAGGGPTIAVLGCGADIVYPKEHAGLAKDVAASGAIVSELLPGTAPHARFFPRRNRLISGLSRAVIVVEAGEKSGSLITARCALEQGRDVLAVPGSILTGRNRGGHRLLRDGARIVETADDILEEIGLETTAPAVDDDGSRKSAGAPGSPARHVLDCLLTGEACDLDAISARSGLVAARLLPCLSELELLGFVRRVGGGRFVRV